jgi:hypothetical protein
VARPQVADIRRVPCHLGMARPQVADIRRVPCHHGMARPQVADVRWVPCHLGMARPQVADIRRVPCHVGMARPQVADIRRVPCHHGMARPQVAGGGDGLQIWRVAANILNISRGQPTMGGPPAWGLGVGLITPHRKKISLLRNVTTDLGNGRTLLINELLRQERGKLNILN